MIRTLTLWLVYKVIMQAYLRVIVGVRYYGTEVLRTKAPFVLVSNHNSHLDTVAMLCALPLGQLVKTHPIAAADYFGNSPVQAFLTRYFVNALLIKRTRESGDISPIDLMGQVLRNGESLILFPEGTRGEPEKMQSFKKGVGVLLSRNPDVPFIPVFMKGMGRVLPRGEKLMVPFDTYVVFGSAQHIVSHEVDDIVADIEDAILDLAEDSFEPLDPA
jgi:1-acyl-sn-glycerol-3-phosphate acyltransferase